MFSIFEQLYIEWSIFIGSILRANSAKVYIHVTCIKYLRLVVIK